MIFQHPNSKPGVCHADTGCLSLFRKRPQTGRGTHGDVPPFGGPAHPGDHPPPDRQRRQTFPPPPAPGRRGTLRLQGGSPLPPVGDHRVHPHRHPSARRRDRPCGDQAGKGFRKPGLGQCGERSRRGFPLLQILPSDDRRRQHGHPQAHLHHDEHDVRGRGLSTDEGGRRNHHRKGIPPRSSRRRRRF